MCRVKGDEPSERCESFCSPFCPIHTDRACKAGLFSVGSGRAPSRYKTKIIFYFSNQLIFKFRCMRNAFRVRACLRRLAGAQMREKI